MYLIVLNPVSGSGRSLRMIGEIEAIMRERGLEYRIHKSESGDDIRQAVHRGCEESVEGIVAVGGDGTMFHVANGLTRSDIPVLFVSCGTGNDFVRVLDLPKDPIEALKVQLDAPIGHIDMGAMNEYRFFNVSGTGFDVDVLRKVDGYKGKYSGLSAYLHALLDAFRGYKPVKAMVSYDGEPEQEVRFSVLSVGNGRYIGGGMKSVPDARVNDGLFDVITVSPVKKATLLPLLVFFITGKHVRIGLGKLRRCKKLRIRCSGMTINLDGELRDADVAEYTLLENAAAVRLPGLK